MSSLSFYFVAPRIASYLGRLQLVTGHIRAPQAAFRRANGQRAKGMANQSRTISADRLASCCRVSPCIVGRSVALGDGRGFPSEQSGPSAGNCATTAAMTSASAASARPGGWNCFRWAEAEFEASNSDGDGSNSFASRSVRQFSGDHFSGGVAGRAPSSVRASASPSENASSQPKCCSQPPRTNLLLANSGPLVNVRPGPMYRFEAASLRATRARRSFGLVLSVWP